MKQNQKLITPNTVHLFFNIIKGDNEGFYDDDCSFVYKGIRYQIEIILFDKKHLDSIVAFSKKSGFRFAYLPRYRYVTVSNLRLAFFNYNLDEFRHFKKASIQLTGFEHIFIPTEHLTTGFNESGLYKAKMKIALTRKVFFHTNFLIRYYGQRLNEMENNLRAYWALIVTQEENRKNVLTQTNKNNESENL